MGHCTHFVITCILMSNHLSIQPIEYAFNKKVNFKVYFSIKIIIFNEMNNPECDLS